MRSWVKIALVVLVSACFAMAVHAETESKRTSARAASELALKDYRVSHGDVLSVQVFGESELSSDEVNISDGGQISLPLLGDLNVLGMTAEQIADELVAKLREGYLVDPKVSVTVRRYRSVYVNGQVKTPSSFAFEPGLTVRKAISKAGGLTERASTRKIFVISEGRDKPRKVKLDTLLRPGDIVTIEESFF